MRTSVWSPRSDRSPGSLPRGRREQVSSLSLPHLFSAARPQPPSCRQTRSARNGAPRARPRTVPRNVTRSRFCRPRFACAAPRSSSVPAARLRSRRNSAFIFRGSAPTRRSTKTTHPCRRAAEVPRLLSRPTPFAPHSVPPNTPHTRFRADHRRRARRAGVSWPHDRHETARNARHASLIQIRALSIASIGICVRLCGSSPGRRHASALNRTRFRHATITSQVATDERRSLRPLLLREPAGRVDR